MYVSQLVTRFVSLFALCMSASSLAGCSYVVEKSKIYGFPEIVERTPYGIAACIVAVVSLLAAVVGINEGKSSLFLIGIILFALA